MSLMFPKPGKRRREREPGEKDDEHLKLIRQLPCLACGAEPAEAAHLRYGDPMRGKPHTGIGQKPDDKWTTPLCPICHRMGKDCQHSMNERVWWEQQRIDPIPVCERLWEASWRGRKSALPLHTVIETMRAIVRRARRGQL